METSLRKVSLRALKIKINCGSEGGPDYIDTRDNRVYLLGVYSIWLPSGAYSITPDPVLS